MYESKDTNAGNNLQIDVCNPSEEKVSPVLIRRANPFSQLSSSSKTSPSLLSKTSSRTRGRNIMRVRRTVINEEVVTESKFFAKSITDTNDIVTDDSVLCSPGSSSEILREKENIKLEKTDRSIKHR